MVLAEASPVGFPDRGKLVNRAVMEGAMLSKTQRVPRHAGRRTSACQLAPEPLRQSHACLDLHSTDRDGLDVDAERDTQAAAEGHQLKRGCLGMLEGCVEGVL